MVDVTAVAARLALAALLLIGLALLTPVAAQAGDWFAAAYGRRSDRLGAADVRVD